MFLAEAVLLVAVVWLAMRVAALQRKTREMEVRTARLTERVWELERRGAPAVELPVPEVVEKQPVIAEQPAGIELPAVPAGTEEDWETRVGANWLNRMGALILVIGIALFLGYSLTQLGPGGKAGIGAGLGLSLLVGGAALAKRERYRTYSFSLLGAGWAVLYFTTYAAHALPAARVIDSPVAAILLLLLVSGGMIAHALQYRSELAASLAFFMAFAGLNVSPVSSLSVSASLILAISVSGISWRFDWFRLPLLGSILAYVTFAVRYDPAVHSIWILWIYWLTFEAFDLFDAYRRRPRRIERTVFLPNALGFAGAALLTDQHAWPLFFGIAALAYLSSAFIRSRAAQSVHFIEGGYEAAVAVAALMMAISLVERFSGTNMTIALVFEAELVVLAGVSLNSSWLRKFGALMLAAPVIHLAIDATGSETTSLGGMTVQRWTPGALLTVAVLIFNRWLTGQGWYYTAAAGAVLAGVALAELPALWVAPAIAVGGALLIACRIRDLTWSGVGALLLAFLRACSFDRQLTDPVTTGITVTAFYAAQMLWRDTPAYVRLWISVFGTVLLTFLLYRLAPSRSLTVAIGTEAALLLTAGFVFSERVFRLSGLGLFVVCLCRLFIYDFRELDTPSRILSFVVLGLVLLGASWVYTRYREKLSKLL